MRFERFEDILVWQKSKCLVSELYKIFMHHKDFKL